MYTTDKTATELTEFLKTTPFFLDFLHYNSYYQVRYFVPSFTELNTPSWAHIQSIGFDKTGYMVVIAIFEDHSFDKQFALKHAALRVK